MSTVITGDDIEVVVNLTRGGSAFVVPPTATVLAVIRLGNAAAHDPVTMDSGHADADWSVSKMVFELPSAESESLPVTSTGAETLIEIQIQQDGKKHTYLSDPVTIKRGVIA